MQENIASPFLHVCEQMSLNRCDNLEKFVVDISPLPAGLCSTVLNWVTALLQPSLVLGAPKF